MKICDSGIIISAKKYGENSLIVKILSAEHGIYSGFIKSGYGNKKNQHLYQISNLVDFEWQARLEEHLGFIKAELTQSFLGAVLFDQNKLGCVCNIVAIIEQNILEREPHQDLYKKLLDFLKYSLTKDEFNFFADYIKLELKLLDDLGYGIDLSECAVTRSTENLQYVSPKSARAVCWSASIGYENRLLKLPQFLLNPQAEITEQDILDGLKMSSFFVKKYFFQDSKKQLFIPQIKSRSN